MVLKLKKVDPQETVTDKPFKLTLAKEKEGTPNASFHSTGPSTEDLTVPSMTPGSSSLPTTSQSVDPQQQPSTGSTQTQIDPQDDNNR